MDTKNNEPTTKHSELNKDGQLSDDALDAVVGGARDNPFQDAANQRQADFNKAGDTIGGSIGGPYVDGQPI